MNDKKMDEFLNRSVRYYFNGLPVKESINKSLEEVMGCEFPVICGRNKNTCCAECKNKDECNYKCQLDNKECDNYANE